MPRVLSLKKIKGKKEQAHPNSRKSHQIQRAALRDERITAQAITKQKEQMKWINRFGFFKVIATTNPDQLFTEEEVKSLIETYIERNKSELMTLVEERRAGRPKSSRQDLLERAKELELSEYRSGFKVPVMDDLLNLEELRHWKGDVGGLQKIKFQLVIQ
ncbi:Putative uncharacterized protein [Taphrina deformans PYCC 5710]|uniref:Translation machinery-associated protein 16 n=1 Tax=Taphrina deformans (strain PYCC 5710 / ATCC 11124 / CBS 356.35 / IMI 108563 / JCM 9778 / NBRC 8474) TaxID=1097556 RepID=R4X9K0_TAPDE|nr:Putative uncharacterized protein [Taphrina deformans PYCC 5710]|eukprot:CCG80909.1 Putative uncharacterized protein [Taphrina deformans PYCC 5710]